MPGNTNPLVSVIIPSLNASKTIAACLDSLFAQQNILPLPEGVAKRRVSSGHPGTRKEGVGAIIPGSASESRNKIPMEVIVVDNHSTDATKAIAREYTDKVFDINDHVTPPHKACPVVSPEDSTTGVRGGAGGVMKPERSAQRNFGARHAKGEFLLFIDSYHKEVLSGYYPGR